MTIVVRSRRAAIKQASVLTHRTRSQWFEKNLDINVFQREVSYFDRPSYLFLRIFSFCNTVIWKSLLAKDLTNIYYDFQECFPLKPWVSGHQRMFESFSFNAYILNGKNVLTVIQDHLWLPSSFSLMYVIDKFVQAGQAVTIFAAYAIFPWLDITFFRGESLAQPKTHHG